MLITLTYEDGEIDLHPGSVHEDEVRRLYEHGDVGFIAVSTTAVKGVKLSWVCV